MPPLVSVTHYSSAIPSSKWTVGSVMLKLGVDPDLLGWEASEEDWRD